MWGWGNLRPQNKVRVSQLNLQHYDFEGALPHGIIYDEKDRGCGPLESCSNKDTVIIGMP